MSRPAILWRLPTLVAVQATLLISGCGFFKPTTDFSEPMRPALTPLPTVPVAVLYGPNELEAAQQSAIQQARHGTPVNALPYPLVTIR